MTKPLISVSIATICLVTLFVSCSKTITCTDGVITIYPVGFNDRDFDSAFAVRYKKDNAFDSVADSTNILYYSSGDHDTGSLSIMAQHTASGARPQFLIPGYDYKIFLPAAGRTYAITNIVQKGNKTQSYSSGPFNNGVVVGCTNNIISCNLDGNPVSTPGTLQSMQLNIVK